MRRLHHIMPLLSNVCTLICLWSRLLSPWNNRCQNYGHNGLSRDLLSPANDHLESHSAIIRL